MTPHAIGTPRERVTGVILAGGGATRFGGAPKGLMRIGGERIIDRVAAALGPVCDDLLVVANAPDASAWLPGVRTAGDVIRGAGSLGGLQAALTHAASAIVVVAWDMPFVPSELLAQLRTLGTHGATAVVPEGPAGPEPLCAFYDARARAVADRLLSAGERRARALGAAVGATSLGIDEVARHGDPRRIFQNVNTAEELAVADDMAGTLTHTPGASS